MSEPTLSAVMASYNYARYLPIAIEAICTQSYPPKELIIIDDASTDNSVEVIRTYQKRFPFIRLHQNPYNLGVIPTANKAFDLATGDYIVFCGADDQVLPGFFEKSMAMFHRHPHAAICSSHFCIFHEDARTKTKLLGASLAKENAFLSPQKFCQEIKWKDIRLGGQNTIFKREAVIEAGGLLHDLGPMCDWFLLMSLSFRYGVCYVPETLTKMRIHPKSYSQIYACNKKNNREVVKKISSLLEKEFADVGKLFTQSGAIYQMGGDLFPILRKHKKFITLPFLYHHFISQLKSWKHHLFVTLLNRK